MNTNVLLDESYLRFLRDHVRVSTISLSISSFDDETNRLYNGTKERLKVNIKDLCSNIKKYDFNLRLSLNLSDSFNNMAPESIFKQIKTLEADQVTFRVLYKSDKSTLQSEWIDKYAADATLIENIKGYVKQRGRKLEKLAFGAIKHSVNGIGTVIDDDCMSTVEKEVLKYLILRENCKLYSKWDDKGSLIF